MSNEQYLMYLTTNADMWYTTCCMPKPLVDLTGRKYGRLEVLRRDDVEREKWWCRCECGTEKKVRYSSLVSNRTSSCGCMYKDRKNGVIRTTAPQSALLKSKEYRAWQSIKKRCYSKNQQNYKHYGGRGIKMCSEWLNSFENFLRDVGPSPSEEFWLGRCDTGLDFEPGNVRWSTSKEQLCLRRALPITHNFPKPRSRREKLSKYDVEEICQMRARGTHLADIAKQFSVDVSHVSRITRGLARAERSQVLDNAA